MTEDGPERRQHERHPLVLRVEYPDRQIDRSAWTENLSAGGLCIRTDEPFKLGDSITVAVSFPGLLESVEVSGTVAWVRSESISQSRGLGVRVTTDASRRRLAELAILVSAKFSRSNSKPFWVMFVDDNESLVRTYERILRRTRAVREGAVQLLFASDGQDALEVLEQQAVDLIITDLYMPTIDGFELIRHLRKDPATERLLILAISGGTEDESQRAKLAGANEFLQKPFQVGHLLETVACLLEAQLGTRFQLS